MDIKLGYYVTTSSGQFGRVYVMHHDFKSTSESETWFNEQRPRLDKKTRHEQWFSILVQGGGAILVPMSNIKTSKAPSDEVIKLDNMWEDHYFDIKPQPNKNIETYPSNNIQPHQLEKFSQYRIEVMNPDFEDLRVGSEMYLGSIDELHIFLLLEDIDLPLDKIKKILKNYTMDGILNEELSYRHENINNAIVYYEHNKKDGNDFYETPTGYILHIGKKVD